MQMEDTQEAFTGLWNKVEKKLYDVSKKIDSKFNHLMFIILGAIIYKSGFNVWIDEPKGSHS